MIIILPGVPLAQARLRFVNRNRFVQVYDPLTKYKKIIVDQIRDYLTNKYNSWFLFEHPRVSFVFHMPIPVSTRKKDLPAHESGFLKHEKKPDVDNLVKLYLDCLDGIVYEGDQAVQLGPCVKLYHPEPKTIITLEEQSNILQPLEVAQNLWSCLNVEAPEKPLNEQMAFPTDF